MRLPNLFAKPKSGGLDAIFWGDVEGRGDPSMLSKMSSPSGGGVGGLGEKALIGDVAIVGEVAKSRSHDCDGEVDIPPSSLGQSAGEDISEYVPYIP